MKMDFEGLLELKNLSSPMSLLVQVEAYNGYIWSSVGKPLLSIQVEALAKEQDPLQGGAEDATAGAGSEEENAAEGDGSSENGGADGYGGGSGGQMAAGKRKSKSGSSGSGGGTWGGFNAKYENV